MRKVFLFSIILFTSTYLFCTEPIVLTVLDYQDSNKVSTYHDNNNIWKEFEQTHPNIIIKREVLCDEAYTERINTVISSSDLPDIFFMFPDNFSEPLHSITCTKDLACYLEKEGMLDKFNKNILNPNLQEEKHIAVIPYGNAITSFTFANKKLLRDIGLTPATTYNELKAQVPILEKAGIKPIIMGNYDDWVIETCLFSMVIGRFAGPDWADQIKKGTLKFTDDIFLKAIEFIKLLFEEKVLGLESFDMDSYDAVKSFANNEGAYFIDCDYRTNSFLSGYYEEDPLFPLDVQLNDIEIIDFPSIPGENYQKSNSAFIQGGYALNTNLTEGTEKEAAAWELIKWLSGLEVQQYYLDNDRYYPSIEDGISLSNLEPLAIKRYDMNNSLETYTPLFSFQFSNSLSGALSNGLKSLAIGNTTPLEICRILQKYYESGEDWWESTDIFDTSIKEDTDSNGTQLYDEVLKTISGELTSISYKIRKRSDGEISVFIEDDKQEDYIIIRVNDIDHAFTMVYAIESDLNDMYKKDFWGTLVKADTPVKTVIQLLMNVDKNKQYSTWLQFSDTQEFYFNYDMRK